MKPMIRTALTTLTASSFVLAAAGCRHPYRRPDPAVDPEAQVKIVRVTGPAEAHAGEEVEVVVEVASTSDASRIISLFVNGDPYDIAPNAKGRSMKYILKPGLSTLKYKVVILTDGSQMYEARLSK